MNDNVKTLVDETVTVPDSAPVTITVTTPDVDQNSKRNTDGEKAPEVAR